MVGISIIERQHHVAVDAVMNNLDLIGRNVVIFHNHPLGMAADSDNSVGHQEGQGFDLTDQWIASITTGPVAFDRVDMQDQRFARQHLGAQSSPESQPVVGVDDIKFAFAHQFANRLLV